MTNLKGNLGHILGHHYSLRTWIEYGFKYLKNELGWADYRLTTYPTIERWWEIDSNVYLMVSLSTTRKHLGHQHVQSTLRYAQQSDEVADLEIRAWRHRRRRS